LTNDGQNLAHLAALVQCWHSEALPGTLVWTGKEPLKTGHLRRWKEAVN